MYCRFHNMMWSSPIITAYLICGCLIKSVESLETRVITKHNLPQKRLELVFGSQNNGSCTNTSSNGSLVCFGTSVLNDGIIPALDGVTLSSTWAIELFTLNATRGRIVLSFEVDSESHDRMELAVFNCPQMRISLTSFSVYFDESFRPDRHYTSQILGTFIMESQLMATSCNQLLVFCVKYNTTQPSTQFINLVIPNIVNNSDYVFLGEVTFLNGGSEPCDLAMPIQEGPATTDSLTDHDSLPTSATQPTECQVQYHCDSHMATALTTGVISIIITALLVAGISVVIHITMYHCVYKPKLMSAGCHKPEPGSRDATVYDIVDERVRTTLEMKKNESYGVAKSRGNNSEAS